MRGCYDFERTLVTLDTKGFDKFWKKWKIAKKAKKNAKKYNVDIIQKTTGDVATCFHIRP